MKRKFTVWLAACGCTAGLVAQAGGGAAEVFPWTSLAAVDADPGADLIYSPLSLSLAFSMLYAGSAGDSAAELREVFGFAPVAEEPARAAALIDALARFGESKAIQLRIANSVWLQPDFPFEPAYAATVQADYRSEARLTDFSTAPEPARATINKWVEDHTAGRIRDLLPAGSVNPLTRFVLVNALYFKAPWLRPFEPRLTRDAVFHVSASETAEVRMMHQIVGARLLETAFADYLELPFLDPDVSMILVLPRLTSPDSTALLCQAMLTGAASLDATNWPQHLTSLSLPRFRAESNFNLIPPLKAMGLQRVFIPGQAGLTGISPAEDLHVTTVVQKAFIEVVEAGAEAAAATGIVGGVTSVPQVTRTLVFDRPFFAIIRERTTGSILFISRIVRPEDPPEGETPRWEEQLRATLGNDMHGNGDWMETAIGSLRGQLFPWVDHRQFGWINLWGTHPLLWLWLPGTGWLWTDLEDGFPVVRDTRRDVWLRLYPDDTVHPWLFNYDTQAWELPGATP